jgi:hypothetical protein
VLDVEHEQMICALALDRADQAFNIPILPGRAVAAYQWAARLGCTCSKIM